MMIVRLQQASRPAASAPAAASHDSAGAVGLRILAAEVPLLAAALARHPGRARARRRRHRTAYRWGRAWRWWQRLAGVALAGARRRRADGRTRRLRVWVRTRVRIWVRDQLALAGIINRRLRWRRRRWRRRWLSLWLWRWCWSRWRWQDLDFGDETAGLAPELAAELDGVEGPGDEHLLLLVHHLLEDEPATLCVQA